MPVPWKGTPLAKLHGSASNADEIVPPTWSKGVVRTVIPAWKLAHKVLSEATQIRILGYSLPTSDSYVKYLFKSAVIQHDKLKKIDVICMDDSEETTEKRYDEFVKFDYYRFFNGNLADYLMHHQKVCELPPRDHGGVVYDRLEIAHEEYMNGKGSST